MNMFMNIDFQTFQACQEVLDYFKDHADMFETGAARDVKDQVKTIFRFPLSENEDSRERDMQVLVLCRAIADYAMWLWGLSFDDYTGCYRRGVTLLDQVCSVALAGVPTMRPIGTEAA